MTLTYNHARIKRALPLIFCVPGSVLSHPTEEDWLRWAVGWAVHSQETYRLSKVEKNSVMRTEQETAICSPLPSPPKAKSWLAGKDPDAGKDWRQEEKRATEEEVVGWHPCLHGHEFEQTPGDGEGRGSLARLSPCSRSQTQLSNWTTTWVGPHSVAASGVWSSHGLWPTETQTCTVSWLPEVSAEGGRGAKNTSDPDASVSKHEQLWEFRVPSH